MQLHAATGSLGCSCCWVQHCSSNTTEVSLSVPVAGDADLPQHLRKAAARLFPSYPSFPCSRSAGNFYVAYGWLPSYMQVAWKAKPEFTMGECAGNSAA